MVDVKKMLENQLLMSHLHDYHFFRFSKVSNVVVIDVKEFSNSEWIRLEGNLITEVDLSEFSYVTPDFKDLSNFENMLESFVQNNFMSVTQEAKIRQEIESLRQISSLGTWNFDEFGKYFDRSNADETIQPLIVNSIEEMFIPRPPVIQNRRISMKKKYVYIADLIMFMERGMMKVGTVKKIGARYVETIPWVLVNDQYRIQQDRTESVPREEIMASGLRLDKKGNFSEEIKQKISMIINQYMQLNNISEDAFPQSQSHPQSQILNSDEIPVYDTLDMDYFESESEFEE